MGQTPKTFGQLALTRAVQAVYTAPSTGIVADLVTDILLANNTGLDVPQAPTITNVGTAGTTTYTYYVVAIDAWGGKTFISASGTTTTGNATLSGTNYNVITWVPVPGAVTYDILKTNTTTSLATNIMGTASGNNLTYNDTGQATSGYTAPQSNNTGKTVYVSLHRVLNGSNPTLSNRIGAIFSLPVGTSTDFQVNIPLAPGDSIQAKLSSSTNNDANIDNGATVTLSGVEFS